MGEITKPNLVDGLWYWSEKVDGEWQHYRSKTKPTPTNTPQKGQDDA